MSRNFALLQIVGKEQEYFRPTDEIATPELVVVPAPPQDPKKSTADSVSRSLHDQPLFDQPEFDRRSLRFEMEAWQLGELTKLVRGVFLEAGVEPDRAMTNRTVVLSSSESGNGCSWICARVGELLASQVAGSLPGGCQLWRGHVARTLRNAQSSRTLGCAARGGRDRRLCEPVVPPQSGVGECWLRFFCRASGSKSGRFRTHAPEAARTARRFRLRSGGWRFFGIQRRIDRSRKDDRRDCAGSEDSFRSQRANPEPRAGFEICRSADSWSCAQSACELGESFRKPWGLSGWLPCLL
jgi:hypothetical protein